MLSIAEVRTEVILWLLYSVFFHLWRGSGGGGLESIFPTGSSEAQGKDMPLLAVQWAVQWAVPKDKGCLPVC